ncbi:MAG: MarR family transcriptional regulator [Candidatus Thermochlorobacter aerophilum]|jgi:DNA-binding MarR family transcriptional regulator|uniref:MarR family transcriptional regulator n=1 Tax=Candidatus Thermochlorobacter aerophilus TaxID=1868324 RepID=A0A395LXT4_9BACT|nr:MAG: MarR family transcriptional regulator [Candidatus Thermochlorobacter aerophilum]
MRLEDEIKQKSFRCPYQKLQVNLIYTFHWLIPKLQEQFKGSGITMQQYNVLRILRGQFPKPSSLMLLKERMMDKQSDVSRLVSRLVSKGLVKRETCAHDRRKLDVLITKKGLALLEKLDPKVRAAEAHLKTLTPSEAEMLNHLLDKLRG